MSAEQVTSDDVTADTVKAAEQDATAAEKALEDLETRLKRGDLTVTAEQLSAQEQFIRRAKLAAEGVRSLWRDRLARDRAKQIRNLRNEIVAGVPKMGDDLVTALRNAEAAARAFEDLAKVHDDQLAKWVERIHKLGIPAGQLEHGIGVNGSNQVRVGAVTLEPTKAKHRLRALFYNGPENDGGGLVVREAGNPDLAAHYAELNRIGEGL